MLKILVFVRANLGRCEVGTNQPYILLPRGISKDWILIRGTVLTLDLMFAWKNFDDSLGPTSPIYCSHESNSEYYDSSLSSL